MRARKEEAVFCCAVWYLLLAPVRSVVGAIADMIENLGCEEAAEVYYFSWLLLFMVSRSLRSREEAAVCCWS